MSYLIPNFVSNPLTQTVVDILQKIGADSYIYFTSEQMTHLKTNLEKIKSTDKNKTNKLTQVIATITGILAVDTFISDENKSAEKETKVSQQPQQLIQNNKSFFSNKSGTFFDPRKTTINEYIESLINLIDALNNKKGLIISSYVKTINKKIGELNKLGQKQHDWFYYTQSIAESKMIKIDDREYKLINLLIERKDIITDLLKEPEKKDVLENERKDINIEPLIKTKYKHPLDEVIDDWAKLNQKVTSLAKKR